MMAVAAVMAWLLAPAAPAGAGGLTAVPVTEDCSRDEAQGVSRDCERMLYDVFKALRPYSGVPNAKPLYLPGYYGVSTNCLNEGSAFESLSPAAADDCGGNTRPFVVFGYSVFSLVGPCLDAAGDDSGVTVEDGLAFVAGHELAHLAHGHPKGRRDHLETLCDAWIKGLDEFQLSLHIGPLVAKLRSEKKSPAAVRQAAVQRLVEVCLERDSVKESLASLSKPGEFDADADGAALVRLHNADARNARKFSDKAGECVMLRLRELEKADAYGMVPTKHSGHPDTQARAEKLRQLAEMMCAGGPPGALCNPKLPEPSPAGQAAQP